MPPKHSLKEYASSTYYHLYNRGVEKRSIFLDDEDYYVFLSCLHLYLTPPNLQQSPPHASHRLKNYSADISLLAYCLMPNHFHLLVYQLEPTTINYFMRSLMTKFSMFFNKKYGRVGSLFQGVYKAVRVTSEDQLLYLTKYIHRNPIDLLSHPALLDQYRFSSYPHYLQPTEHPYLNHQPILGHFSNTNPHLTYRAFVEDDEEFDPDPSLID